MRCRRCHQDILEYDEYYELPDGEYCAECAEQYYAEQETLVDGMQTCCVCGDRIDADTYEVYSINGDIVCESCHYEYIDELLSERRREYTPSEEAYWDHINAQIEEMRYQRGKRNDD